MNTLNLVKKAIVLLQASNIEEEYEKYKGLYRDDSQLKYMGKLWKHYNATLFDGKLPKFKSIGWRRQSFKNTALGGYDPNLNSLTFKPSIFQLSFDKFKHIFVHEMCHQAQLNVSMPGDKNFIPYIEMDKMQRIQNSINNGYGYEHNSKSWFYWTKKAGITPEDKILNVTLDEITTPKHMEKLNKIRETIKDQDEGVKNSEQVKEPEKYMVVKFFNKNKWEIGMIVGLVRLNWMIVTEETISHNTWYVIQEYRLFKVDSKTEKEVLSNPKFKKYVDYLAKKKKTLDKYPIEEED